MCSVTSFEQKSIIRAKLRIMQPKYNISILKLKYIFLLPNYNCAVFVEKQNIIAVGKA